jgi:hypothetical protein
MMISELASWPVLKVLHTVHLEKGSIAHEAPRTPVRPLGMMRDEVERLAIQFWTLEV